MADGGDATYLCPWMRKSDLADLPPSPPIGNQAACQEAGEEMNALAKVWKA
jgi:hypothetical protein